MKRFTFSISLGLMLSLINPIYANGGSVGGISQEDVQALKQNSKQNNPTQKDIQASNIEPEQATKDQSAKQ